MAYKIKYRNRFIKDMFAVLTYVEREWGNKAAKDFQTKVDDILSILITHPFVGAPSFKFPGLRGIHITHHNRIFYRVDGNVIFIMFLADTRRKIYET